MDTLNAVVKAFGLEAPDPHVGQVAVDFNRDNLANLFFELGYNVGAEIGVERGLYSQKLCEMNPFLKLYCIDPWEVYPEYEDNTDPHIAHIDYAKATRRLQPYNCILLRQTSMAAVESFGPGNLDFVYIDGNHTLPYITEDLEAWYPVVRKGGIVSGHDYIWRAHGKRRDDVKQAVDKFVASHNIRPLFLLTKKGSSTWFFIHP